VFLCNYRAPSTERLQVAANRRWVTRFPGEGAQAGPAGGLALSLGKRRAGGVARRKPAGKKAVAKKAGAKTAAGKKAVAKKAVAKQAVTKKPATRKPAGKRVRSRA
jgi:hypothetical protein